MLRASILVGDPKSERALPLAFLLLHHRLYTILRRCGRLHRHPATLPVAGNPGEEIKARHRETPRLRHRLHFSFLLLIPQNLHINGRKLWRVAHRWERRRGKIVAATTPSTKFPSSTHNFGAFDPRSLPRQSTASSLLCLLVPSKSRDVP